MAQPKMKYICQIPECGKEICQAPPMTIPGINADPDKNAKQVVEAISNHLMRKHQIGFWGDWQQFLGYMNLGTVRSDDPAVSQFMAQFAARLCAVSCIRVSDDQIVSLVAQMGFTMEDPMRLKVIEGMRRLRDVVSRQIPLEVPRS
jgi:hypothetical protein